MTQISVVVPAHNRSAFLRQALHSELWQTDVALDVIVVDDGSTDDTSDFVTALSDDRIRLVRHERTKGISVARNRGFAEARGEGSRS